MEDKETINLNMTNNKYIWIIGGLIVLVVGWFVFKTLLASFEGYKTTLVDAPKESPAGSVMTFTWRIDGSPTTINHTAVHFGLESNPGILETKVAPADTKYTDFVKDFAEGQYDIPLQFIGNVKVDEPGTYYFRVHAQVKDKHFWSDEYTFTVLPTDYRISLVNSPKEVTVGSMTTFTWRVEGPATTINHTAVYMGTVSNPGSLGREVEPKNTKYTEFSKDFVKGGYKIPLQFIGNYKITKEGTYFFRIYVDVDDKHYWTDEYSFEAKSKVSPTE